MRELVENSAIMQDSIEAIKEVLQEYKANANRMTVDQPQQQPQPVPTYHSAT
jgi:hypothetical protein